MYVCICNKVTDTQIRHAARNGNCSADAVCAQLNVGTGCGKCKQCAKEIVHEAINTTWQLESSSQLVPQMAACG